MTTSLTIGTAIAKPGTIQYGSWNAFTHPTGHVEFLPVIIVQGKENGPCLWLTAGIHGPEHSGPAVIYNLITQELADRLAGTIVAIPALSPAGLRTINRLPYHAQTDPNRLWPDGKPNQSDDPEKEPPTSLERAYKRLFDEMSASADFLIDLHNAWIGSLPFSCRDRILYRDDQDADKNKAAAETVLVRQSEMLQAYGHTIVNDLPLSYYYDADLHRSTAGAAVILQHIPAFTVELSGGQMPDPVIVASSAAGIRNVMRWAGMLDSFLEPITSVKVVDPGFPVRRCMTPRVSEACVVLHLVQPGDMVQAGDPVAELRDIWGRPIGDGILHSEFDGFVLGRAHGIYFYPGQAILSMAIRDDTPLVFPYPQKYYE